MTTHATDVGFEATIPVWRGEESWLCVEREPPRRMTDTHWHSHIEINYLVDCAMTYTSGNQEVYVPARRIALFWASVPHQVTEVEGSGQLTCVYLPLEEFMRWGLPVRFCHEVMHGDFLMSLEDDPADRVTFDRWLQDYRRQDETFRRQALDEIHLRLRRMALAGWQLGNSEHAPVRTASGNLARGISHVEAIATFIAARYHEPICVNDVAEHVGLHPNYAMTLFKRVVGLPIAAYLTRHRLSHAQAMLLNTDKKILAIAMDCGFGSLSRFYEAFRSQLHKTPRQYRDEWQRS